jgi:hypothetical protein
MVISDSKQGKLPVLRFLSHRIGKQTGRAAEKPESREVWKQKPGGREGGKE